MTTGRPLISLTLIALLSPAVASGQTGDTESASEQTPTEANAEERGEHGAAHEDDSDEEEEGGHGHHPVLRLGTVEISPDFKLYADYQIDVASADVKNAFHLTRAYLGIRLRLNSWIGARVTYDVSQATDLGRAGAAPIDEDGEAAVVDGSRVQGSMLARLKYGYLDLDVEALSLDLRFGVIHTPWIDWIEHIEDSRLFRKVMLENEYHYPSADFGVAVVGHVSDYLAYHIGFYNGEGYHGVEDTRFKDFIGRVSFRPAPRVRGVSGLMLSGYYQVELPSTDIDPDHSTHRRFGGALTYRLAEELTSADTARVRGDRLAAWVQAFYGQDGPADHLIPSLGISAGVRVELPALLFVLARLDRFDHDLNHDDEVLWTVLGALGLRPARGVIFALNYQGRLGHGHDRHLVGIHAELRL